MLEHGFYNLDCMEGMKEIPDNYFHLAIVDPPYGDASGGGRAADRFGQRFDRYKTTGDRSAHRRGDLAHEISASENPP